MNQKHLDEFVDRYGLEGWRVVLELYVQKYAPMEVADRLIKILDELQVAIVKFYE